MAGTSGRNSMSHHNRLLQSCLLVDPKPILHQNMTHCRWAHKSVRRRLTIDTSRKHPTVASTELVVYLRGKELLHQGGSWSSQRRGSPRHFVVASEGIQSPQTRRTAAGACSVYRQLVVAPRSSSPLTPTLIPIPIFVEINLNCVLLMSHFW